MAIKGWRRTKNTKYMVIYKSNRDRIIVLEGNLGKPFTKNAWYVTGKDYDKTKFIHSGVTGRKNAIRTAVDYMKKHPKG